MKAVMYHYVRQSDPELPFFRYLSIDNFRSQLDFFEKKYGVVTYDELLNLINGTIELSDIGTKVLLTFDDGFIDHYKMVFPELKKRGLTGIFYVPTGVYEKHKALDVHRIHHLLGLCGGTRLVKALNALLEDNMIDKTHYTDFRHHTYLEQDNDSATEEFKKILNYYIKYEFREQLLDKLVLEFSNDFKIYNNLYMTLDNIQEMKEGKMIIGSHGVNHFVFSKLSDKEQYSELYDSFSFIEKRVGKQALKTFCYPYGGFSTFTEETERILNDLGCDFSFNVESRDVTKDDLEMRPQALPRYDCNLFPYGKASLG